MSRRAKPSFVVTHHAPLEGAPNLYAAFDKRAEGAVKAIARPQLGTNDSELYASAEDMCVSCMFTHTRVADFGTR